MVPWKTEDANPPVLNVFLVFFVRVFAPFMGVYEVVAVRDYWYYHNFRPLDPKVILLRTRKLADW